MRGAELANGAEAAAWPAMMSRSIELSDDGLICGARSVLVRMEGKGPRATRLALDADGPRLLAMLSVAFGRPVAADILAPLQDAAAHWQRGDKALANLRLIFAGLPKLQAPADAYRLRLAEHLLDQGMAPEALMKELGLEPTAHGLVKYNPNELRVPSGHGVESGRWTDGLFPVLDLKDDHPFVVAQNDDHHDDEKSKDERRTSGQYVPEADGPLNPLDGMPAGYGYGEQAPADPATPSRGRLGNAATRALNAQIAAELKNQGYTIIGGGGEPEEYIKGEGPGTRGSTYVDVTAQHGITGDVLRVQTIDTLADGSPTPREAAASARIQNAYPNGKLLLIRKK